MVMAVEKCICPTRHLESWPEVITVFQSFMNHDKYVHECQFSYIFHNIYQNNVAATFLKPELCLFLPENKTHYSLCMKNIEN